MLRVGEIGSSRDEHSDWLASANGQPRKHAYKQQTEQVVFKYICIHICKYIYLYISIYHGFEFEN